MALRRIRCGLLSANRWDWAVSMALACPGLEFSTLSPARLGLSEVPNPFGLPEDDRVEVGLVGDSFWDWLTVRHPDRVDPVFRALIACADTCVGLDSSDQLALAFPPQAVDRLALVIKGQGVYRDRDLYNYEIGPVCDGAFWSTKRKPRRERYSDGDLERIRLSLPCFMYSPGLQRAARRREGTSAYTGSRPMGRLERTMRNGAELLLAGIAELAPARRDLDVHCATTLTHVQRLEAIEQLEGLTGLHGITALRPSVFGTGFGRNVPPETHAQIVDRAMPQMLEHQGRLRYLREMRRHRVIVAPTGYGELTFRHGEALRTGGALVCQDLRHVELMFPLRDHENVVFCRPDLADLRTRVVELLEDEVMCRAIASEGRRSFATWSRSWRDELRKGIENHVREASAPSLTSVTASDPACD